MSNPLAPHQVAILVRAEVFELGSTGKLTKPVKRVSNVYTVTGNSLDEVEQQLEEIFQRVKNAETEKGKCEEGGCSEGDIQSE